jgi:NitT/TauT family transport system substrate-binding protein
MKPRNILIASAVAVTMLAAGCSSGGSGSGTTRLKLEKTNITVAAFPAIDSAGLYVAQDEGLFAAQGLNVTIQQFPTNAPPPTTQVLIKDQVSGKYDITAGDYVTYIENQLGADGAPRNDLRLVAEASFLQPNVLTVLVKGGSQISQVSQLKGKTVSVNATNDIGTLLIDSLLEGHGLKPQQINYTTLPFPAVAQTLTEAKSPIVAAFAPEPFVSSGEAQFGVQELADLDQGSTADFPIQGYAVTADWAKKYPNTLKAFTTALDQGQQAADTDRAATEAAIEKYLGIPKQSAAFISLPAFPLGIDSVRLQRVVSAMSRFGLLPPKSKFQVTSMISG